MEWSFSTMHVGDQGIQCSFTMIKLMVEKSHDGVGDEYSTELQALAGLLQWLCMDVLYIQMISPTSLKSKWIALNYPSIRWMFVWLTGSLLSFISLSLYVQQLSRFFMVWWGVFQDVSWSEALRLLDEQRRVFTGVPVILLKAITCTIRNVKHQKLELLLIKEILTCIST